MIDISQAVEKLRQKELDPTAIQSGMDRRRLTLRSVHSAIGDRQMVVTAVPDDLVESVLATFCLELNIARLPADLVLRGADRILIDPVMTVGQAKLENGDVVTLESLTADRVQLGHNFWPLAGLSLIIGAAGFCAILILFFVPTIPIVDFGVVVSGEYQRSRVFTYKWSGKKANFTAENLQQQKYICVANASGLSGFESDPNSAGPSLSVCLNATRDDQIPADRHSATHVFMAASSGIRLVALRNSSVADAIMTSVASELGATPFHSEGVEILQGAEETKYLWMAANWLGDTLQVHMSEEPKAIESTSIWFQSATDTPTAGVISLDGGAVAIGFEVAEEAELPEGSDVLNTTVMGRRNRLFAQNSVCYGYEEADRRILAALILNSSDLSVPLRNPCGQLGTTRLVAIDRIFVPPCVDANSTMPPTFDRVTFEGTGDPPSCVSLIGRLLSRSACRSPECHLGENNLTSLWPKKFVGTNEFYRVASRFNISSGSGLLTKFRSAVDQHCRQRAKRSETDGDPTDFCSFGLYAIELLTSALGFNQTTFDRIKFVDKIDSVAVGWQLGLMLDRSSPLPTDPRVEQIGSILFWCLSAIFALLLLMSLAFCTVALRTDRSRNLLGYNPL